MQVAGCQVSGLGRILGRFRGGSEVPEPRDLARRVDRVAPWLFIGPHLLIDQYLDLRRRGVTHIVDLRDEGSDDAQTIEQLGFRWRRVLISDGHAPTDRQLADLITWLDADADPNVDQAVYIHGHGGLGRTPTIAIALLMQHDLKLAEAQRMVFAVRPESAPTASQLEWLRTVEDSVRRRVTGA